MSDTHWASIEGTIQNLIESKEMGVGEREAYCELSILKTSNKIVTECRVINSQSHGEKRRSLHLYLCYANQQGFTFLIFFLSNCVF